MSWLGSVGKKTFKNLSNSSLEFSIGMFIVLMPMVDTVSMKYDTMYILYRYDEAAIEFKPYRQKDGALLAIGALCDKLKQTEPYKSELERMLVQHVFPEFSSPVGHLRAKVWLTVINNTITYQM